MNDADGFRLEAACQFGFETTNDDADEYKCTEAALLAFVKACERKGRAEAIKIADDLYGEGPSAPWDNGGTSDGWDRGTQKIVELLTTLNVAADAELAPILAAEEVRSMTAAGYVRGTDEPGKRWIKPSEELVQISDCNCRQPGLGGDCDGSCQHPMPPAKNFWCVVALDYDKDEAWILDQSQDARDCDLLDGSSGDDNGLIQDWVKEAVPGLYKLYLRPWGYQDYQGEWETGVDVSIVTLLVAFPDREREPCEYCGTGPCENCMNTGLKNPTAEDLR